MRVIIKENENYTLLVSGIECTNDEIYDKAIVGTSDYDDITLIKKLWEFMNSTLHKLIKVFATNFKTQINNDLKSKNNLHMALDLTNIYGLKVSLEAIKKQVKTN